MLLITTKRRTGSTKEEKETKGDQKDDEDETDAIAAESAEGLTHVHANRSPKQEAWRLLCQTIFLSNEFFYLR